MSVCRVLDPGKLPDKGLALSRLADLEAELSMIENATPGPADVVLPFGFSRAELEALGDAIQKIPPHKLH